MSLPEKLDEPATQEALVSMVRSQLSCCAQAKGAVVEQLQHTHLYMLLTLCLTGSLIRTQRLVGGSSAMLAEVRSSFMTG